MVTGHGQGGKSAMFARTEQSARAGATDAGVNGFCWGANDNLGNPPREVSGQAAIRRFSRIEGERCGPSFPSHDSCQGRATPCDL